MNTKRVVSIGIVFFFSVGILGSATNACESCALTNRADALASSLLVPAATYNFSAPLEALKGNSNARFGEQSGSNSANPVVVDKDGNNPLAQTGTSATPQVDPSNPPPAPSISGSEHSAEDYNKKADETVHKTDGESHPHKSSFFSKIGKLIGAVFPKDARFYSILMGSIIGIATGIVVGMATGNPAMSFLAGSLAGVAAPAGIGHFLKYLKNH